MGDGNKHPISHQRAMMSCYIRIMNIVGYLIEGAAYSMLAMMRSDARVERINPQEYIQIYVNASGDYPRPDYMWLADDVDSSMEWNISKTQSHTHLIRITNTLRRIASVAFNSKLSFLNYSLSSQSTKETDNF